MRSGILPKDKSTKEYTVEFTQGIPGAIPLLTESMEIFPDLSE